MERIRVSKKESNFLYNLVVILLVGGILFFSYRLFINSRDSMKGEGFEGDLKGLETAEENQRYMGNNDFFSDIWTRISGMKFTDPTFILSAQIPYLNAANKSETVDDKRLDKEENDIVATIADRGDELSRQGERPSGDDLELYRETDEPEEGVSQEIKIEIKKIRDSLPSVPIDGKGPQIFIYHTHSREAYRQDPEAPYKAVANCRSMDPRVTVMGVGEELARQLNDKGIPVLHERTDHEVHPWKGGLYPKSLETIQKRRKEHESLKIFLDVHRNYQKSLKDPDKEVVIIDGERVAKFFVLIGTAEGIKGGYDKKPKWRENYQFALKLTNKVNEKYPGLATDIRVQSGRYNQHISNKAILLEVGNQLTTFAEAERTSKYIAEALSDIIEK